MLQRPKPFGPLQASIREGGTAEGVEPESTPLLRQACEQYVKQKTLSGQDSGGAAGRGGAPHGRDISGLQGHLQAPAGSGGVPKAALSEAANPLLRQACEQYVKGMPQSGPEPASSAGHGAAAAPLGKQSLRHEAVPTSAEAVASLRMEAKWSALVARLMAWNRKAAAATGGLLLAHAKSSEPLRLRDERVLTHLFLRDAAWVSIFPDLAVRCQEQLAARLGVEPRAERYLATGATVRCAANPRCAQALAQWLPGSSGHGKPLMKSLGFMPVGGLASGEPAGTAADSADDAPPGLPQRQAWAFLQTNDSLPEMPNWRDRRNLQTNDSLPEMPDWRDRRPWQTMDNLPEHPLQTNDSLPEMPDWRDRRPLQTNDSLPEMPDWRERRPLQTMDSLPETPDWRDRRPLQTNDSLPEMPDWRDRRPLQTMDSLPEMTEMPDRRRQDSQGVLTLESIAGYGDLGGVMGWQTSDSLPDMVEPSTAAMFQATCDSLPDIIMTMGPPVNSINRSPYLSPPAQGSAQGGASLFAQPPVGDGGRPPLEGGGRSFAV